MLFRSVSQSRYVVPICQFVHVKRQILFADMVELPVHGPFNDGPKAFDCGGGGGGSFGGDPSGAGGDGADGQIIIIEQF